MVGDEGEQCALQTTGQRTPKEPLDRGQKGVDFDLELRRVWTVAVAYEVDLVEVEQEISRPRTRFLQQRGQIGQGLGKGVAGMDLCTLQVCVRTGRRRKGAALKNETFDP